VEPWYRLAVVIILPLMTLLFRRAFSGAEHLPKSGGVILAVNHISYADPFAVALFVHTNGRRPRFMAKASVFRIPLLGRIVKGARQIPVFRESADAGKALSAAVDAVKRGECVVVYPEGTVTKDPDYWPMVAKTGVARIALQTGAPVIPVGQWGAQEFLGRSGRPRPFPRKRLHVRAGAPVDLSQWNGAEPTVDVLRAMTSKIMAEVTALVAELRGETPPATPYVPPRRLEAVRDDDTRRSA
jgi:1-acyl-sn-glycerol-3-phosphate acyltransferase